MLDLMRARRIALTALILLVTMTLLFSMVYLVPGDPASIALGRGRLRQ
jgi:ABC-type dipeptide/oligopeptide/nickel transport system permease component